MVGLYGRMIGEGEISKGGRSKEIQGMDRLPSLLAPWVNSMVVSSLIDDL